MELLALFSIGFDPSFVSKFPLIVYLNKLEDHYLTRCSSKYYMITLPSYVLRRYDHVVCYFCNLYVPLNDSSMMHSKDEVTRKKDVEEMKRQ